jgi:hypothetical protein
MPSQIDAPSWRDRAATARALAETMEYELSLRILEELTVGYERLADTVERFAGVKAAAAAKEST